MIAVFITEMVILFKHVIIIIIIIIVIIIIIIIRTQRSSMWEKIADTLNKCTVLKFRADKRSVGDHVGILVTSIRRNF